MSNDGSRKAGQEGTETIAGVRESVVFRSIVAWFELTIVGGAGTIGGSFLSGPVQFVVFLATTLATVVVLFHNVDRLVSDRVERR